MSLIIKELPILSKPRPLVVMYNSHSQAWTIKAKDIMVPEFETTCNSYFENESEQEKEERIVKSINGLIFDMLASSSQIYNFDKFSLYVTDFLDF